MTNQTITPPASKQEAIDLLTSDVQAWNRMREANPEWITDLLCADLRGAYLRGADLLCADLRGADLCDAKVSRKQLTPYNGEPNWQE